MLEFTFDVVSLVSLMFWPVRELSILFVSTSTWAAACGRTARPEVTANITTTRMPLVFGRRSERMRAPFNDGTTSRRIHRASNHFQINEQGRRSFSRQETLLLTELSQS